MVVEETHLFRVTRDADVAIAEDEAGDLLETMEKARKRERKRKREKEKERERKREKERERERERKEERKKEKEREKERKIERKIERKKRFVCLTLFRCAGDETASVRPRRARRSANW
jgi:flagellar biosynthesis GTPase FlhF